MEGIVIVISEFLERHSKVKFTRAPAHSRALQRIKRSPKGKLVHGKLRHRRQSWGVGGSRPPDFWQGGCRGGRRGFAGGRGVVKYYYIGSCTGSVFESGDF